MAEGSALAAKIIEVSEFSEFMDKMHKLAKLRVWTLREILMLLEPEHLRRLWQEEMIL